MTFKYTKYYKEEPQETVELVAGSKTELEGTLLRVHLHSEGAGGIITVTDKISNRIEQYRLDPSKQKPHQVLGQKKNKQYGSKFFQLGMPTETPSAVLVKAFTYKSPFED